MSDCYSSVVLDFGHTPSQGKCRDLAEKSSGDESLELSPVPGDATLKMKGVLADALWMTSDVIRDSASSGWYLDLVSQKGGISAEE